MCPADLMIIRQFKDMSRSMIGRPDVPTSVPPPPLFLSTVLGS